MSGEHRYHSAPTSKEYRENFDRIFRGKRVEDECAGLNLEEIAFYDKYGYFECGYALVGQPDGSLKGEEFKRQYQQDQHWADVVQKQRDALVQAAQIGANIEKACARVMNEAFGERLTLAEAVERSQDGDVITILPDGTINAPGRAIHGLSQHSPARGMLGRDGT